MPWAAPRPCQRPGCGALTKAGRYCLKHAKTEPRRREAERGSSSKRGYGRRWRRERLAYLAANTLCVRCMAAGRVTAATVVDHIKAHRGDKRLFWDQVNWQSLCKPCHDRKTATEDR